MIFRRRGGSGAGPSNTTGMHRSPALAIAAGRTSRAALALLLLLVGALVAGALGGPVTAVGANGPVEGSEVVTYRPGGLVGGTRVGSVAVAPEEARDLPLQAAYVGRQALEPTIGVDADGTAIMTAAFHDGLAVVLPETWVFRSTDGGLNWEEVTKRTPVVDRPEPFVNADPFILTDQETGRTFQPELTGGCMYMNITDDMGDSWTTQPLSCGTVPVDHHSVEVGPFPPALAALEGDYPNIVYHCSNRIVDVACGRSMDGGLTWTPGGEPAYAAFTEELGLCTGGLHGHIASDSEGRIFLPKGHCGQMAVAVSDDGALTWDRTYVSTEIGTASTHTAVAVDDEDNVYALWWDDEQRLPWLSVSTDHGATWGEPIMVAPPGVREVNWPVLEAGDAGTVAIAFPGTTVGDRQDNRRAWNHYTVVGTGLLGEDPIFTSATANDPADPVHRGNCGPGRCGALWDFEDIQVAPSTGEFWAVMADACTNEACITGASGDNESTGQGIVVRQLGGPMVRTVEPAAAE